MVPFHGVNYRVFNDKNFAHGLLQEHLGKQANQEKHLDLDGGALEGFRPGSASVT